MGGATIDAPAAGATALVIIDMINDTTFEGAEGLRPGARDAAAAIVRLHAEADAAGVPVVYVNDNSGQWHSERGPLVDRAAEGEAQDIVRALAIMRNSMSAETRPTLELSLAGWLHEAG